MTLSANLTRVCVDWDCSRPCFIQNDGSVPYGRYYFELDGVKPAISRRGVINIMLPLARVQFVVALASLESYFMLSAMTEYPDPIRQAAGDRCARRTLAALLTASGDFSGASLRVCSFHIRSSLPR